MLSYPQLRLPEAWKPLFRALAEAGWDYQESLPEQPEWTPRPVLRFENRLEPWLGDRFLVFLEEPEWCGNAYQKSGFSIAAMCGKAPGSREEAEQATLALMGDWEAGLEEFVGEVAGLPLVQG